MTRRRTRRCWLAMLALSVGAGPPEAALAAAWSEAAALPEPRQEVAVAALAERIYVIGGFLADLGISDRVDVYDPVADTWTQASPLPIGLHHAAAATAAGRLYVLGGFTDRFFLAPSDRLLEYDPNTDTWSDRAPLPSARGALAVAVIEDRIYAAGGSPAARERDFAVYEPGTGLWTTLASLPTARNHLAAGAIDGRLYVVGGRSGGIGGITSALEEFDPRTGAWTPRAPMPSARGGLAAAVSGGRLFVFGGEGNGLEPSGVFEQVEAYDPSTDSWSEQPPMPTPRHGIGAASIDGFIHVPGGATREGFGVSAVHEVFEPAPFPCGDLDADGVVDPDDVALYRSHLADPGARPLSPAALARCSVRGGARDCDVADVVVLRRVLHTPSLAPGVAPVCGEAADGIW